MSPQTRNHTDISKLNARQFDAILLAQLRRQDATVVGAAGITILVAAPLLLVGPFLLACVFWFATFSFGRYYPGQH